MVRMTETQRSKELGLWIAPIVRIPHSYPIRGYLIIKPSGTQNNCTFGSLRGCPESPGGRPETIEG